MILFKNKLKRNKLINKLLKYRNDNQYENNNFFKNYLVIIENELKKSNFGSDSDFIIKGRREFLVNEFYKVLNNEDNYNKKNCIDDPLYFALGNLEEILMGNNVVTFKDVDENKKTFNEDGTYSVDGNYLRELIDIDRRYTEKGIICLEEKQMIEKMINDFKNVLPNTIFFKNNENTKDEKYYYKFIPYKKIGPISLDKNEYLKPNGVPYLYENCLNHVLSQSLWIDYPEHIEKLKKRDYVYIEYGNTIIELTCNFKKLKNELNKICDDIILRKEDDRLVASSKKLGIIIIAEKNNNPEYKGEFEFYIRYIKFVGKEQFKKFEDEERNNKMNKELKINNNVVFEDEETKVEFQKYLDEINEYNRKIQNGEDPDVNPADLLNKYREKFYDEELENKMKELDEQKNIFKFENNEIDELKNKLDAKLKELEENNTNGD